MSQPRLHSTFERIAPWTCARRTLRTAFRIILALVAAAMLLVPDGVPAAKRRHQPVVAVTVDDLPAHSALPRGDTRTRVADAFIAALTTARIPSPYGFVNGATLDQQPDAAGVLEAWRRAGFPLGNHGWSHKRLDAIGATGFADELVRNEPLLRRMGGDWHWFRYPFVAEGQDPLVRDAARSILHAHGYRIAAVTMSFGDYAWNEPYARCIARGDEVAIAMLERSYLTAARAEAERSRAMSKRLFRRDIPYVLLLHIGAFDARMLPRLLALYRTLDFGFVTLPQAEADPAYRSAVDFRLRYTPSALEERLTARGERAPPSTFDLKTLDQVCR